MKVDIYRNLQKDCWSIRSREKSNYGLVVKHVNWALLENAKFVVSQAGRNRVLKEKQKNVHAVVRGNLVDCKLEKAPWPWRVLLESTPLKRVSYHPYRKSTFFWADTEKSVKSSSLVHFGSDMMVHADSA